LSDREERRLIGSYRLIDWRDFADDGEVRQSLGADPVGFIVYTVERCMTALVMAADRANFAGDDIRAGTDVERVQAFATASAFAGRWRIEDDVVVHELEAATFPNWTGTVQRRPYRIDGKVLTLYPPRLLLDGKLRRSELTWRRLERDNW